MIDIEIGFTRTDPTPDGRIPMIDGYRFGDPQDVVTVSLPDSPLPNHVWAEAVFVATNAPVEVIAGDSNAAVVMLTMGSAPRAVSIGDTVTVGNRVWVCQRIGWSVHDRDGREITPVNCPQCGYEGEMVIPHDHEPAITDPTRDPCRYCN